MAGMERPKTTLEIKTNPKLNPNNDAAERMREVIRLDQSMRDALDQNALRSVRVSGTTPFPIATEKAVSAVVPQNPATKLNDLHLPARPNLSSDVDGAEIMREVVGFDQSMRGALDQAALKSVGHLLPNIPIFAQVMQADREQRMQADREQRILRLCGEIKGTDFTGQEEKEKMVFDFLGGLENYNKVEPDQRSVYLIEKITVLSDEQRGSLHRVLHPAK